MQLRAVLCIGIANLIAAHANCGEVACGPDLYQCALALINHNDLQNAALKLQDLIRSQPGNLKAQNLLGIVLLESGKPVEAEKEFRKALAVEPGFSAARKNLGVAQFTLGRFSEAQGSFEGVLREKADDPTASLYLGELTYRSGNCAKALGNFRNAGKQIVSIPAFAVHYADCLIRSGKTAESISVVEQIDESAGEAQFAAGVLYAKSKSFAAAARCFHRAQRRYNNPCTAGYDEALMDLRGEIYQGAIDTVERVLAGCQSKGELLNIEAAAYRKLNRVSEAYNALKKAAQLSPYDEQNYIDLADLCLDYNNYDLGAEILDVGLKSIPDSVRIYLHKGVMEAMRANLVKAETDFQFAADLAPDAALPKAALSLTWMAMGEVQKAIQTLREFDKANRTDFAIAYLLGQSLMRQGASTGPGEEDEAIAAFQKAIRLNPEYAPARAELGKLLLRKGEEARGIVELEKSLSLDPQERTAAYQLAQVYRKKGNLQRASELVARVRNLNTEDRDQDLKRAMISIVRQTAIGQGHTGTADSSAGLLR
jgi:tetratricopeptide (TPR) repeat protein